LANFSFVSQQERFFASKKKKFGKAGDEGSRSEEAHDDAAASHSHHDWKSEANKDSSDAAKLTSD
jgi:hypothetical protein